MSRSRGPPCSIPPLRRSGGGRRPRYRRARGLRRDARRLQWAASRFSWSEFPVGSCRSCPGLIYGASGAIGTAGVQLAKYFGAHVTAVTSTKNLELVKSLGADHVIDYTKEDFTKNGQSYDVIFDAVGKHSFVRSRNSLKPGGRFLPTDGFDNLLRVLTTRFQDKKVIFPAGAVTKKEVVFLKELIEAGRYRVVIDRTYALEDVVEAHRYVDTEQKVGNVIQ